MAEVTYYVMGIQSDHYKSGATLLTDISKFVLIPEVSEKQTTVVYLSIVTAVTYNNGKVQIGIWWCS